MNPFITYVAKDGRQYNLPLPVHATYYALTELPDQIVISVAYKQAADNSLGQIERRARDAMPLLLWRRVPNTLSVGYKGGAPLPFEEPIRFLIDPVSGGLKPASSAVYNRLLRAAPDESLSMPGSALGDVLIALRDLGVSYSS